MDPTVFLTSAAHALGLDQWLPILLAFHTLAAAIDAAVPQPAPGSNWLPLRKILSIIALNLGHSTNAEQPPLVTWLQAVVQRLSAMTPPPGQGQQRPAPLFPTPGALPPLAPPAPAPAPQRMDPVVTMPPMPSPSAVPPPPSPGPA